MPTLEWIGKDKVVNHHQQVPFRTLKRKFSYDGQGQHDQDNGSKNMIIHGDNLEALKALLPQYEGRVKCIYIDPPYNTGNEKWVYNDNVNDPKIKKWLGEVVGAEGEDLSRHDKWLCMMYPRLKLLQKLLADDGAIFISISDVEHSNLKLICDEIFGANCFAANISWQNNYSLRNDSKGLPYETDNILIYSKRPGWEPKRLARTAEMDARYINPDNDENSYKVIPAHAPGAITHKGMVYAIQHPVTGQLIYPPSSRHWKDAQSKILSIINEWAPFELREIDDEKKRAEICNSSENLPRVKAIMLSVPLEKAKECALERYSKGKWPQYYFSSKCYGGIQTKGYLNKAAGKVVSTLWSYDEVGTNVEATNELKPIFAGTAQFDTPKPVRLLSRILEIATDSDSIVLDSFAGSGTTAHAVLNANKADGGNRNFILVELMDYADSITSERVRRVISGYGEGKNTVPGTGGNFSFYELGTTILLPDGNLNEEVHEDKIRSYVYYMETKEAIPERDDFDCKYFLGKCKDMAYYFYYEKAAVTTLDHDFLAKVKTSADGYTIYADLCTLPDSDLKKWNVSFKKIPRDIAKL